MEQFLADFPTGGGDRGGRGSVRFRPPPGIRSPARASASCTSGRRSAIRFAACSMPKANGRTLRLQVLRFGQSQPKLIEICADRDRRCGAANRTRTKIISIACSSVFCAENILLQDRTLQRQPRSGAFFQPGLHPRPAAVGPVGICRARRQCRRDPDVGRCRAHLRHSLDGLSAAAARRPAHVEGLKLFLPPRAVRRSFGSARLTECRGGEVAAL